jgi:hypothetical protein
MKYISILSLVAVVGFFLLPSCSAVKWAVPAGAGADMDDESWASRYIPGVKAISNFVPQPTEARVQWDERYKKREHWGSPTDLYP